MKHKQTHFSRNAEKEFPADTKSQRENKMGNKQGFQLQRERERERS